MVDLSVFDREMAERYTGSYPDCPYGWRAAAILADIGQASLVEHISFGEIRALAQTGQE